MVTLLLLIVILSSSFQWNNFYYLSTLTSVYVSVHCEISVDLRIHEWVVIHREEKDNGRVTEDTFSIFTGLDPALEFIF